MKKNQIILLFWATFFISFFLFTSVLQAKPAKPSEKPNFQFLVFPDTIYTDSEITLSICLVNQGGAGQIIYEGSDSDHIAISLPLGSDPDDLIDDAEPLTFSCSSQDPLWICEEVDITEDEIFFIFHPEGTVYVMEGETICFDIIPVNVNLEPGLAFLPIDQQIDKNRVDKSKNSILSIIKTSNTISVFQEADPLFSEMDTEMELENQLNDVSNVFTNNDGKLTDDDLSDNQIGDLPDVDATGAANDQILKYMNGTWKVANDNTGIITETDPTIAESVKDGVSWGEVTNIPEDFADGTDDGITTENDPTVPANIKDGINWSEISNRPAGLDDGDNIGITSIPANIIEEGENISLLNNDIGYLTSETDPTVPSNLKDGVSWSEISNRPVGLDDGDNIGITSIPANIIEEGENISLLNNNIGYLTIETDPTVSEDLKINYIPKWDGSMLINSGSIFEDAGGNIGIGTTAPEERFHIVDDYRAAVKCETFTEHITRAGTINFSKARGNAADPEIILEGDIIGKSSFRAYDGVNFESAASFGAIIDGTPSEGADMPGALFFSTTPDDSDKVVERMRINNQGNVGIGTSSPDYTLDVNGDIHYTGSIYDFSDIRLKENIKPIENAMEKVSVINGIYFTHIGQSPQVQEVGVIAQDVEIVLPEAVSEDNEGYKSVDYSKLTPLLIEAVKELKALNEALLIKNSILEARISALEERII